MLGEMPRRILLVEDEAALADALRFALEREGYAVDVARDGRAALDAFDDSRTALVILDLMLPGMAGLDVCRAIRERSDVPVVITTAKDAERDVVAGDHLLAQDPVPFHQGFYGLANRLLGQVAHPQDLHLESVQLFVEPTPRVLHQPNRPVT